MKHIRYFTGQVSYLEESYIKMFEKFYNPPLAIKNKLDIIVKELLSTYGGGRKFFDALDDSIKSIYNENMIIALLRGNSDNWVASSGEFGDKIYNLWKNGKIRCKGVVVFNGKMLTNNLGVNSWYPKDFDISNKEFIYADDSYFSGGTVRKIGNFLLDRGSKIKHVSVIYDGSKERSDFVNSFFRYYN